MIDIDALLAANDGLLMARDHRRHKSSFSRWVREGKLVRLMRGVYAHPNHHPHDRVRAVLAAIPGAVVADETAMAIWFGPERPLGVISVCTPGRRRPQPGYRFTQRPIPREHARRGVMKPPLAAVDLADEDPSWLDELARRRIAGPRQYEQILAEFPGRPGNPARRRRVARSRSRPWSPAEREYHDLLDAHRVTGWVGNHPIQVGEQIYVPDIAFEAEKLVIEIDGYAHHSDRSSFESDRRRRNDLTLAGWTVLQFTWAMLDDPEQIVRTVRGARSRLRRARRRRGASKSSSRSLT